MADDKKKKDGEDERSYQGSKVPKDRAFAEWINAQWKRGEHVDLIEVVEFFPKGARKGFGDVVGSANFPVKHEVDMEQATDLSNVLLGKAQLVCDRIHKKPMQFYVRAYDKGRQDTQTPIEVFPLDLVPDDRYKNGHGAGTGDEPADAQTLALTYLQQGMQAYQFDRQREDSNTGDLIALYHVERREMRAWIADLMNMVRGVMGEWVGAVREREKALSEEADRLPRRMLTEIKAEVLRDGFRTSKNLLTAAAARFLGSGEGGPPDGAANADPGNSSGPIVHEMTAERLLLDEFFADCKSAKIDVPLFGEWEKDEHGRLVCTREGVIKPAQFITLLKVKEGYATADALDDLVIGSGKPLEITMAQLDLAQKIPGMSQGIGASIISLFTLRRNKQQARAQAPQTAQVASPAAPAISPNSDNKDDFDV